MNKILEIKNLTKNYGKIVGVTDLSLSLNEGEIFGFIGPNGAGKSTTIRSVMNLINKNNGEVYFLGKELIKNDVLLKEQIGYLPGEISLYDDLTVKEMLKYHESFYKKDITKRKEELIKLLKLDVTKKVEDLSLGNLKKLGIILAFMHEPKLLILDEPTSGLDPIMQQTFYKLLKEERKKGTAIFYSTHVLGEISLVCDRVGIIKDGKLLKIETIEDLGKKYLAFVTVVSKECEDIIRDLKIEVVFQEDNLIKFKNTMSINQLIDNLSKYKLDKLLIEEATLEDIFYHYYQ